MITRPASSRGESAATAVERDVREREVRVRELAVAAIGLPDVDRDAVVGRVPFGRLDRLRVEVEREHRLEAELCRRDREDAGAAADVEHAPPLARPRAARGRAASSDARRFRTRGRDRSRPRSHPRRAPPRAARSRASRRGRAGGTAASDPPSRPRRRTPRRRRTPARCAPRRLRSCTPRARARPRLRSPRSLPGRARSSRHAPLRPERRGRSPRRGAGASRRPRHSAKGAPELLEEALVDAGRCSSSDSVSKRSRSSRCSSVRRRGTATLTSTRWSPRRERSSDGIPLPRSTRTSPGCVPGSKSSSELAVERGHGDSRAERGLDDRQVDLRENVVAVAHEARVAGDAHLDVHIAGASSVRARMALATETDALAVVDPRRDLDLELARLEREAGALADGAGRLGHAARTAAGRARLGADELAEDAAGDLLQLSLAAAGRAGDALRPGLGALAVAALAGRRDLELGHPGHAGERIGELDLDRDTDVAAARPAAPVARRRGRRRRRPRRCR